MRTESRWVDAYERTYIQKYFPDRIQKDLLNEDIILSKLPNVNFEEGQGLYLHGDNMTGKTLMAAKLLLEEQKRIWLKGAEEMQRGFEFVSTPKLLFNIRQTYNKKKLTDDNETLEEQMLRHYGRTYFLVFDDFGVEGKPTEWVLNTLYLIINERYEHLLPTVFTSNFNLDQITEIFDARISTRIDRMCLVLKKQPWDKDND